ncbi:MAG: hypothetical protein HOV80_16180 [Polyangiaceae bacterium]|nr:hypothetical protein [Polyangiaceae bacterium]
MSTFRGYGLACATLLLVACGDDAAGTTAATTTTTGSGGGATTSGPTTTTTVSPASSSSTGAGGQDPLSIAAEIDGYRIELPCENADPQAYNPGDTCAWDPALADQTGDPDWELKIEVDKVIGGDPNTVYDVEMRFRGVSEPKNYQDGTVVADHFYIGGTEVLNDYNVYSITVGDPAQVYYLNRNEAATGHYMIQLDYTVTIPMRGGTTVTIGMYDHNTQAIANGEKFVVDGIPPAPDPFAGHFIQMDVVSVAPQR